MEGLCLENFVNDTLLRSFQGVLGKNGHTFMRLQDWKNEMSFILRRALEQCDFSMPCIFCEFKDKKECGEFKKNFIQSIVPAWIEQQMEQKLLALCYWDKEKSRLHLFKTLDRAVKSKEDVWVADYSAVRAEADIAHRILNWNLHERKIDEDLLGRALKWSQINEDFQLSPDQEEVVRRVLKQRFVVVDGGPGTGKTTILRVIYQYYVNQFRDDDVFCAAPTGKAAKRLSEVTHSGAQTLHRLLGADYDEETEETTFYFDEKTKHPGKVFILDEASMIDANIFSSFLAAVSDKAIIVLVGDSHQLPSVGAGRVLADLIASELVTVCTLVENFRQLQNSQIVKNASHILHGRPVEILENEKTDCHLIACGKDRIMDRISEWVRSINPELHMDVWRDMAILCPKRNGQISTDSINAFLQKQYSVMRNTSRVPLTYKENMTKYFAMSDRVIQIKNNYKLPCYDADGSTNDGVFNGDIGFIRKVYRSSDLGVDVNFDDGRNTTYPLKNVGELELAYALTVHKAQGAEWKHVLLVLPDEYGPIFNRNLLYTAVTRAKEELWILGDMRTIDRMISRPYSDERKTALRIFLTERTEKKEQSDEEKTGSEEPK